MSLDIAIAGVGGRMGRALVQCAAGDGRYRIVGGSERAGSDHIGADVGLAAGVGALGVATCEDARSAGREAQAWIDFSTPGASLAALDALSDVENVRAAVIGATGFDADQERALLAHAQRYALVRSGNFSLGVTMLTALVEQVAARLSADWDIEIFEAHHRRKIDAPSGTALMLGEAAAKGRGADLSTLRLGPHDGVGGARVRGGIGFSVQRAGGLVGEHEVLFAAEREVLALSHVALDRAVFAEGALAAGLWVSQQAPGLYSMRDVVGM